MFSREESKKLRQEFWISFGKSFPRKWILYNTRIRDFSFKFYFDTKKALVTLDIEDPDIEIRHMYFDKVCSLRSILLEDYLPDLLFEKACYLDNGKEISRIYDLKTAVSIHNKNTWQETMVFLNDRMLRFEAFFTEYEDFLKA
ncbi:DUF4268 domain-containing protein [Ascidiimonas aurantiaca]|uniref:DUF4268 domain-containing protein n=1 Tax=Ascidiimonas aurantiaca TaxID=1685432 RepID=UPI0030ED4F19